MINRRLIWKQAAVIMTALVVSCQTAATSKPPEDFANATFNIERQSVVLVNGSAEQAAAPGSAAKAVTKLSDKQAVGDVNGDGKPDVGVVLVHAPGGSGTFYYVAAVLNDGTEKGQTTNAVLLGDRISLEQVNIAKGRIAVDYLERRSGEPMTAPPSAKATKQFALKDGKLLIVP